MSSEQHWTIDSIAHALPHPLTRQKFLAEVNLAPVGELPAVLGRWVGVAQDWIEAQPRIEALRQHVKDHGGLPAEYESGLVDVTDRVVGEARDVRGVA